MNFNRKDFSVSAFGIIVLLIFFLNACQNKQDPMASIPLGEISGSEFLEKFLKQGLIEINSFEDTDSLITYKIGTDKQFQSTLWVNPGRYKFQKVNSVEILFGSDSVSGFLEEMIYKPGEGDLEREKLNSVIDQFKNWYGEPHITFSHSELFSEIYKVIEVNKNQNEGAKRGKLAGAFDAMYGISRYLIWQLDGYNLMISYRENEDDSLSSLNTIRYEVNRFEDILKKEKEKVLKSAVLNDYIDMSLNLDPFTEAQFPYTDRLNLSAIGIGHKLPEEERDIRRFKFDAIVKNEYGDLILLIPDVDLELDSPLQSPSSGLFRKTSGGYSYSVFFNRNNSNGQDYEKLRRLREQKISSGNFSDIKLEYEITAIIFEDGEVIKK
ncbi:MAG: hypothetical protein C0433_19160 [Cyclobacterium sp.]|nr:hypothetical protein [Cyclobacterium sp.]